MRLPLFLLLRVRSQPRACAGIGRAFIATIITIHDDHFFCRADNVGVLRLTTPHRRGVWRRICEALADTTYGGTEAPFLLRRAEPGPSVFIGSY